MKKGPSGFSHDLARVSNFIMGSNIPRRFARLELVHTRCDNAQAGEARFGVPLNYVAGNGSFSD